jgi:hypothetical protein
VYIFFFIKAEAMFKSNGIDIKDEESKKNLNIVDTLINKSVEYNQKKEFVSNDFKLSPGKHILLIYTEVSLRFFQGKYFDKLVKVEEKEEKNDKRERKKRIVFDGKYPTEEEEENIKLEIKPKKRKIESEDICFICKTNSKESLKPCSKCSKVYHKSCVGDFHFNFSASKNQWYCPCHFCCKCFNSVTTSGGLIFKCENCINCFCYNCFDIKNSDVLETPSNSINYSKTSIYIKCFKCKTN